MASIIARPTSSAASALNGSAITASASSIVCASRRLSTSSEDIGTKTPDATARAQRPAYRCAPVELMSGAESTGYPVVTGLRPTAPKAPNRSGLASTSSGDSGRHSGMWTIPGSSSSQSPK